MLNLGNSVSNPTFAKTKPSLPRFFPHLASFTEVPAAPDRRPVALNRG
jgi:hypothetical protein